MASPVSNYVIQCFLRTTAITQIGKNLIQSFICPFCVKHNPCQIINVKLTDAYTAAFRENIQTVISLLERQKYKEAAGKVHEQYFNKLKGQYWYETGLIDDETTKLFRALDDNAYAMKYYLDGDYTLAYTSMHNKDASLLPASLQAQYAKYSETVMAAYQKYLLEWQRQQNYGNTPANRKDDNGCRNDAYDVCDYSDPYEFWY